MERTPQPQEEFASSFDRDAVAVAATETAQVMIAERIDASLAGEERFAAMVTLMEELAEDNGNRFIVEAMAQRLTYEKKLQELQTLEEFYPLAV
ncbi:MAG: hypothetical protein RL097_189 [Candidatus Parcubacteria bacterium]|jgi:hypothetical protein